jgi:hypothetical protein
MKLTKSNIKSDSNKLKEKKLKLLYKGYIDSIIYGHSIIIIGKHKLYIDATYIVQKGD